MDLLPYESMGYTNHKSDTKTVAIPTYNRAGTPLHTTLNRTTIDVVIPWVNYSSGYHENEKVPFDFGEPLINIVSTVGLKRPPWSEICWTVRSILFYGSQYIRNVYIVYNSYRHAAPDCHFGDNVISMPQQVFLKGTILEGLSSPKPHAVFPFFHRIKSLSDYFLFSMDDIFLLKPFDLDTFYDSNSQQILTHMTGGIRGISAGSYESNMALERIFGRPGQFSDGLHVPFLVKKKSQEDMMHSLPFLFSKCSEPKHLCDFGIQYQTLIQNYMVLSGTARNSAATIGFSEIHTDEQTNLKQALHVSATWLNVQGTGVSDEYGGTKSARIRLRTVFDSWLIKQPFYQDVQDRLSRFPNYWSSPEVQKEDAKKEQSKLAVEAEEAKNAIELAAKISHSSHNSTTATTATTATSTSKTKTHNGYKNR